MAVEQRLDFLPAVLSTWSTPQERYAQRRAEAKARRERRRAFLATIDDLVERHGHEVDSKVIHVTSLQTPIACVTIGEIEVELLLTRSWRVGLLGEVGMSLEQWYAVELRRAGEEEFHRFFSLKQESALYYNGKETLQTYPRNRWGSGPSITDYNQTLALLSAIEGHFSN